MFPLGVDGADSPSPVPTEEESLLSSNAATGEETTTLIQAGLQNQLQRDHMAALGTLSAGLAHEINNPLTCVLLNLHFVVRRLRAASASDETFTELAGGAREGLAGLVQALLHAVEGANRIRQVVGDVSTFAQGNVERRELVDVRGILESSMQLAWQEIRHRAHLSRTLAKVPPVEANEARLGQLFLCLLVNAAHAIPEGQADRHEVRVMTKTDAGNNAVVEISDTGRGIAPENLSRVFDPFFTTERQNGSGLGLAISYGTVKSLGGEIAVTSEPGRGTTFRVILRPAELSPAGMPPRRNGGPATLRRRVLVIDDDRLVGEAIARAVSETHDVEIVTETCHALDRITGSERHNVIVCELMMPVMTGMDLYAKILPRDPTLAGRFVFTTTGAFSARARAFLESVSNACLPKPLDMGRLRSIVARANRLSAFEGSLPPG